MHLLILPAPPAARPPCHHPLLLQLLLQALHLSCGQPPPASLLLHLLLLPLLLRLHLRLHLLLLLEKFCLVLSLQMLHLMLLLLLLLLRQLLLLSPELLLPRTLLCVERSQLRLPLLLRR